LTCRHWGTETLRSMFIVDSKPRNLNGLAILDWLKSNSEEYKQGKQFARDLEVSSNLSDLKSINAWHDSFYNIVSDLKELYGCEIKKEEFKVELVDYVGSKIPKYKVEYGKNLISNEAEEDLTITKGVLAKGYDKLYADNIIYSGKLSTNINMLGETVEKVYPVRVKEEGKENDEGYTYYNTEEEAKAELERLARLEFTVNKIDEPKMTFDTKFLELSTVEEHKDDTKVWLSIGDKIATYIPKFNIDIETRIIEMEVDVLADEVTNITLSNNDIKDLKPPTLNSIKKEIEKLPTVEDVILTAKKESINTVMDGFGGYSHYAKNFTAWTDETDIKQARKGIVANKHGIMFFRNGINIETGEANDVTLIMDINGNFNCSILNSGEINAALIKTGIIRGFNDNLIINLNAGEVTFRKGKLEGNNALIDITNGNIYTKANGNKALEFVGRTINFYDWEGTTRTSPVGFIYSSRRNGDANKTGLGIANGINSYFSIGYDESESTNINRSYVDFDYYGVTGNPKPITFFEGVKFWQNINLEGSKILGGELSSPNGQLGFYALNGGTYISGKTTVIGDFSVVGNKNCIQPTQKYGNRLFYSTEDTESYLTDTCSELMTVSKTETGIFERVILIDTIFKECANLENNYIIDIHKIGWGDFKIKDQTKDYFIVESDREDFTFKYTIKAKRKGYENLRLEKFSQEI
ncbi:phage minor structural protein, partial [Clostridium sartagoforme AAU1]